MENYTYCKSLINYQRRPTLEVPIGHIPLGGNNPIRVQSMTTCDTMDTKGTVAQAIRMVEAGCEYVRITAPGIKEAANLKNIKKELVRRGVHVPLVADIHYTPNAAMEAAKHVEKVRINPGNYADKKKFETHNYTDASYLEELDRIKEKFIPLINQCKKYHTALRIGTNHGSLSDRILSRYGDTPLGMVESALEFLRICEEEQFYHIVLSMKASNTRVMVQAYRLLVNRLEEEGLKPYPLHLGVTEAGDGEDGRIKSAVGIGTLLEDGLGDTIRVSLTEEPEYEIPVAQTLVKRYTNYQSITLNRQPVFSKNPFEYSARPTIQVNDFGHKTPPRVLANYSRQPITKQALKAMGYRYMQATDKWISLDTAADYVYLGKTPGTKELPAGLKRIVDAELWQPGTPQVYPCFTVATIVKDIPKHPDLNFVWVHLPLKQPLPPLDNTTVLIATTHAEHPMPVFRQFALYLMQQHSKQPVVWAYQYVQTNNASDFQLFSATDIGGVLIDGLGNGIMLSHQTNTPELANNTAFGILQAARTRMSKTEYISCPSCGRTLFDLQQTTARIKSKTDHLKGVKIGIMGCIVNGPGEMADADYGYVGAGIDKISLYKGQEVVKKGLKPEVAVDALIQLIKDNGQWVEPEAKQ